MAQNSISATVFRGGTSKGVYFERSGMPDNEDWDEVLLKTFGSPDPMQLDGIGGSHSTTSKAMIVSPSEREGVDATYQFAQVAVEKPVVDWGGNCGNLTFAIGPFAIEQEIIDPEIHDGKAEIVLENTNTGTAVEQSIPIDAEGNVQYAGDFKVNGVPGTGGRIRSSFLDPSGSVTDTLFPTGDRTELISVPGIGDIEATFIDVTNPCVFVRAEAVGITGAELPSEINEDEELLDRLERIRSEACARLGFVDDAKDATAESPGIPKIAVVGKRQDYRTVNGDRVAADEYTLLARIMSMQKAHHAYAVTGSMATAAAALIDGTIPNEYVAEPDSEEVILGHPKGTMTIGVGLDDDDVTYTTVDRTARSIMSGDLYYLPEK